jgi:ubiquitin-like protein 4
MPTAMKKRKKVVPGQVPTINVSMKSIRSPARTITLPSQPISTSILSLKSTAAEKLGVSIDKVRMLYKKKPCSETKILSDLVGAEDVDVEFTIMISGGAAADVVKAPRAEPVVNAKPIGEAELETGEFWDDLKGFLLQRLKDEVVAERVYKKFMESLTDS